MLDYNKIMIMRKPTQVCSDCKHIQPPEQTVFPNFQDVADPKKEFLNLKDCLQFFYNAQREYKSALQSNINLLESFPHSKDNKDKCVEQRKYVYEKLKEIESYLIDNVIKMYCTLPK